MTARLTRVLTIAVTVFVLLISQRSAAETKQSFSIGYFEAGPYPVHSVLRAEFYSQLEQIIPDNYEFVIIPNGFRSAEWKRDQCRAMAHELVREKDIDILIAVGPWVVHDLIEAGYDRPIIAMHQFDPSAEGLLDATGRPVASNLTVHYRPGKIVEDLTILSRLVDVKRLGFLSFPSADEKDELLNTVSEIGSRLGFEVVTAEGFDNNGTFAFFKSFKSLDKDIDAIYLPPLWGLKTTNLSQFLEMVSDAGVPSFTFEGKVILEKGAFATSSLYSVVSEARFNADKAVSIMKGELPADLPVSFRSGRALAVNGIAARKCGIDLPEEVLSDFYVIDAPVRDDVFRFNLNDAIDRAMNQNPGYQAQRDALEVAAKAAQQAYSDYLPKIYSTTHVTHVDDNLTSNFRDFISNDLYATSVSLEQQIFSLQTIRDIQLGASHRQMEGINVIRSQLDLELAVSLAYLNYLRSEDILRAYRTNRSLIEHNLELALARIQTGDGDSLDVVRLEDERYQGTLKVIDARSNRKVARVMLNSLFNLPGNEILALDTSAFSEAYFLKNEGKLYTHIKDGPAQEQLANKLVARALALNPNTQSHRVRLDIQRGLLSKNKARYFPTVGLKASLNLSDWLEERGTFEEENSSWSVSGIVNIPIFLGADRLRERAKLKAGLSELEYRRDETSLQVMRDVQTNIHQLIASANKITPAAQSRKRSLKALDIVVPAYGTGETPLINLLDAQSNGLEAELAGINARYSYYETMARLVHVVGWTVHDNYSSFQQEFHSQIEN